MLVWSTDTEVVDGVETQRVHAGGKGAFGRHGGRYMELVVE